MARLARVKEELRRAYLRADLGFLEQAIAGGWRDGSTATTAVLVRFAIGGGCAIQEARCCQTAKQLMAPPLEHRYTQTHTDTPARGWPSGMLEVLQVADLLTISAGGHDSALPERWRFSDGKACRR